MSTNLKVYEKDLEALARLGSELKHALQYSVNKESFVKRVKEEIKANYPEDTPADIKKMEKEFLEKLPVFNTEYQKWYSEALSLLKQLLPDRVDDFISHYKKPRVKRKEITFENYVIQDGLQGLRITRGWEEDVVVDASAAIPQFQQQLAILQSAKQRFKTSLFDIRNLVQADLLDSEIDAARELHKNKFYRASGVICGVSLEKHLGEICNQYNIKFRKKNLTIADLNDALKKEGVIDTPQWRHLQFLGDIRNKCGHSKADQPTKEEVEDLINGTNKVVKTIF